MIINQLNEKAYQFVNELTLFFNKRIIDPITVTIDGNEKSPSFTVQFIAYNYYPVVCLYSENCYSFSLRMYQTDIPLNIICQDDNPIILRNVFLQLQKELERRIPDNFLEMHHWKS